MFVVWSLVGPVVPSKFVGPLPSIHIASLFNISLLCQEQSLPSKSQLPTEGCLKFYYRLFGKQVDVGTLEAFIRPAGSHTSSTILWMMAFSKGDEWHRALIPIPASEVQIPFEVIF